MTGYFQAFELDELEKKHAAAGSPYSEFLRRRGVSMGMYTLPAGTADHQHPHSADGSTSSCAAGARSRSSTPTTR